MRDGRIRLSKEYGLNPAIPRCYLCGKEKNEIILPGVMRGKDGKDIEAPKGMVWDREPCDECKDWMKQGVILISVKDGEERPMGPLRAGEQRVIEDNPYRTGGWCVLRDEAVKRIFTGEAVDDLIKKRVGFVEDEVWNMVGLPRSGEEVGGVG